MVTIQTIAALVIGISPLSIEASISDAVVPQGDIVTVELTIVAKVDGQMDIAAPEVEGLKEISRSHSEGVTTEWTDEGERQTRERTVVIEYQTEKPGKMTLPPFTVTVGEQIARSEPVRVEVRATEVKGKVVKAHRVAPPDKSEAPIFVRYRVDKNTAYLGEQILLDLEVFARPTVSFSVEKSASPIAPDGFWTELVERNKRLERRTESIRGRQYHVYRVWRLALFPVESGKRTIDRSTLTFGLNRTIFGPGSRIRRQALPVELDIKPLPKKGRPAGFVASNVGKYELSASLNKRQVPAGKAVVLTLVLAGRGNIKAAQLPSVSKLAGFRTFAPTVRDEISKSAIGIAGQKRAEILLMPTRPGRLEIQGLSMDIFDPTEGGYKKLTTSSMRLLAEGQMPRKLAVATRTEPGDGPSRSAEIGLRAIRHRFTDKNFLDGVLTQSELVALLGLPPFFLLLIWVARRKREVEQLEDAEQVDPSRATRKALTRAKQIFPAEPEKAHRMMQQALIEHVSILCGRPLRGLTHGELEAELLEDGAKQALAGQVRSLLEHADYARYAPGLVEQEDADHFEQRYETVIIALNDSSFGASD